MKLLLFVFTLWCFKVMKAEITHVDIQLSGCTETDKEFITELDGDELIHSDFNKKVVVNSLPEFADPMEWPGFYDQSVSEQGICKQNLDTAKSSYKNPPEALDVPQNSIYVKAKVQVGSENTLICHSARFFPPPVNMRWTKNGEDVTDRAALSQFYPNKDNTYNQFSHLPFTPQDGDVYTCTVNHKALQTPDTKTWDVELASKRSGVGPSVFCGVGLVVGLLGVAIGTFFLIKGNKCN